MRAPRYEDQDQYGYHSGGQLCGLSTILTLVFFGHLFMSNEVILAYLGSTKEVCTIFDDLKQNC